MPLRTVLPLILLLASARWAQAGDAVALSDGEAFTFRVSWGIFGDAGEIKVRAEAAEVAGLPHTRVITTTKTQGVIGLLYAFTGEEVGLFDAHDGRLMTARAVTRAGKHQTSASIVFDYAKASASYVDNLKPERNATLPLPAGQPMDMITCLIQARAWQLRAGGTHEALALFDNEFYPLTITAVGLEKIPTPSGTREAMLLVPKMAGTPKGMFRKGGEIRVWISNDTQRLPLKFEVKVKVGTATATLLDYTPPAKKPEPPGPPAPPATAPPPPVKP